MLFWRHYSRNAHVRPPSWPIFLAFWRQVPFNARQTRLWATFCTTRPKDLFGNLRYPIHCLSRFGCRFKIAFIILRVYHRKSCTAIYAAKRELRDRNLLQDFIPASVHKYVQSLTVHRISYFYKTYHENISFIPKKNNNEIIPSKWRRLNLLERLLPKISVGRIRSPNRYVQLQRVVSTKVRNLMKNLMAILLYKTTPSSYILLDI